MIRRAWSRAAEGSQGYGRGEISRTGQRAGRVYSGAAQKSRGRLLRPRRSGIRLPELSPHVDRAKRRGGVIFHRAGRSHRQTQLPRCRTLGFKRFHGRFELLWNPCRSLWSSARRISERALVGEPSGRSDRCARVHKFALGLLKNSDTVMVSLRLDLHFRGENSVVRIAFPDNVSRQSVNFGQRVKRDKGSVLHKNPSGLL